MSDPDWLHDDEAFARVKARVLGNALADMVHPAPDDDLPYYASRRVIALPPLPDQED